MKFKTKFLKNKSQWTAYTTYRGMDICELNENEAEAIIALMKRIK